MIELPPPGGAGESVTVDLEGTIRLPNKQGRWGHWDGVTYLDERAAGPRLLRRRRLARRCRSSRGTSRSSTRPASTPPRSRCRPTRSSPAPRRSPSETDLGDGWKRVVTEPFVGRDFAVAVQRRLPGVHSATTRCPDGREVKLRCLAFARARVLRHGDPQDRRRGDPGLLRVVRPVPVRPVHRRRVVLRVERQRVRRPGHDRRAGLRHAAPRPRVRRVPGVARDLPPVVVQPGRHQRVRRAVHGRGGRRRTSPTGCSTASTARTTRCWSGRGGSEWLPNIRRENYRYGGMYRGDPQRRDAAGRGQDLPQYGHLFGAVHRGLRPRVEGVRHDRGPARQPAFLDFMRELVDEVLVRVLSAAEFKAELTRTPAAAATWDEFFDRWVYGNGLTDWEVESVRVDGRRGPGCAGAVRSAHDGRRPGRGRRHAEAASIDEPTVVGVPVRRRRRVPGPRSGRAGSQPVERPGARRRGRAAGRRPVRGPRHAAGRADAGRDRPGPRAARRQPGRTTPGSGRPECASRRSTRCSTRPT